MVELYIFVSRVNIAYTCTVNDTNVTFLLFFFFAIMGLRNRALYEFSFGPYSQIMRRAGGIK